MPKQLSIVVCEPDSSERDRAYNAHEAFRSINYFASDSFVGTQSYLCDDLCDALIVSTRVPYYRLEKDFLPELGLAAALVAKARDHGIPYVLHNDPVNVFPPQSKGDRTRRGYDFERILRDVHKVEYSSGVGTSWVYADDSHTREPGLKDWHDSIFFSILLARMPRFNPFVRQQAKEGFSHTRSDLKRAISRGSYTSLRKLMNDVSDDYCTKTTWKFP